MDWKSGVALLQRLQQPNAQARLVSGALLLLVLLIAYSLAQFTWLLVPGLPPEARVPPPAPSAAASAGLTQDGGASQRDAGKDIASWHLFGRADLVAAAPPKQEVIAETTLQLELRGILASSDASLARALIAEPAREEKPYAVGATDIPGGATIKEIRADHVVLSRGGRLETLRLPKDKLGSGAVEPVSLPQRGVQPLPTEAPGREFTGSESLRDLRDAVINDPQLLAGFLQAEPVQGPNGIAGFRLGSGQDPQLLRRFGLQRGDVVTAVNDIQLDAVTKVPQLLQALPGAGELTIKFQRNGKDRSVTLNLQ